MPTDRIVTISASGNLTGGGSADYTSWSTLESTERADLVSLDRRLIIEVDKIDGHIVQAGSTNFSAANWTTDATRYILIRPRAGSKHNGTDDGSATMEISGGNGALINASGVTMTIEDMILIVGGSVNFSRTVLGEQACTLLVQRCVCVHSSSNSSNELFRLSTTSASASITLRNNIVYTTTTCSNGFFVNAKNASAPFVIDNNTVVGSFSVAGINANSLTPTVRNNLVENSGAGSDYANMSSATTATNISSDATSPEGASFQSITASYVNAGSRDYHLAAAISPAGTDLSGTFTDDVDGDTRATWNVGADFFSAAAPSPSGNRLMWW